MKLSVQTTTTTEPTTTTTRTTTTTTEPTTTTTSTTPTTTSSTTTNNGTSIPKLIYINIDIFTICVLKLYKACVFNSCTYQYKRRLQHSQYQQLQKQQQKLLQFRQLKPPRMVLIYLC